MQAEEIDNTFIVDAAKITYLFNRRVGVVVITSPLHGEGHGFDPRTQLVTIFSCMYRTKR